MGKKIGIVAAVCCALALCLALVGCGGGVDKSNYTGDWKLAYSSEENLDAESIELLESLGATAKLTLNEDGTGSFDLFGKTIKAKWEASSNTEGKINLDEGGEGSLKLENEELTIVDAAGASMTFKRMS